MQSNRLTIIPVDGAVYMDQGVYVDLDLADCSIPTNIHALQWLNGSGWIEFTNTDPNEEINTLPQWALNCVGKWQIKYEESLSVVEPIDEQQVDPPTE